jgi:hypothetical protein
MTKKTISSRGLYNFHLVSVSKFINRPKYTNVFDGRFNLIFSSSSIDSWRIEIHLVPVFLSID